MFRALVPLGKMGARIAHYINELKALMRRKDETIAELKGQAQHAEEAQIDVHQREFPSAAQPIIPLKPHPPRDHVFSDRHTQGPWRMSRSGMVRTGADWICAVTARNRIYNGPLIEAAPDMLAMLERMLSSPSPEEARSIVADAHTLVRTAKTPAWERKQTA